jgi:hypothetical protein
MSILVLTSDTLIGTPATGNLEYNGQFYGTDSALSRAQMQRITLGTAVASTSGTSIDFTNLPAWVKRITVQFQGVSLNSTGHILVQLGTGATPTYTTSGYLSTALAAVAGGNTLISSTAGNIIYLASAASSLDGHMIITNISGNNWVSSHTAKYSTTTVCAGSCDVSLGAVLTAVRITTSTGTDTFDAGSVNIMYEG